MRYELNDFEWTAIKPMLPNKPRGVRRVSDRRVLNGISWVLRFRCTMARPCSRIIADTRLLQSLRSLAGVWDQIMDALTAAHDAAVQMIDTSVVRVHQHGACVADNKHYRAMSLHSGSPQSREKGRARPHRGGILDAALRIAEGVVPVDT
jgi:transposase